MTQTITNFRAVRAQQVAANLEGYLEYGAETRTEYLAMLADEYDVPLSTVRAMASVLGPTEDFDGLVCALEDGDGYE
jgi:hypothetical protein